MKQIERFTIGLSVCLLSLSVASNANAGRFSSGLKLEDKVQFQTFRAVPHRRDYLPEKVDLAPYFPKPGDQGSQGSCTAWASGYAVRGYYETRKENSSVPMSFSPAYIYNQIKDNDGSCTSGTRISSALKLMSEQGIAPLEEFPYVTQDCSRQPDTRVRSDAKNFRIKSWSRVNTAQLDDVKGQLADGHPIIVGMYVNEKFENLGEHQIYAAPASSDNGYAHAVVMIGYDEQRQAFKFLNSWGEEWGEGGYGWVSYEAFKTNAQAGFVVRTYDSPDKYPPLEIAALEEKAQPVAVVTPPTPAPAPTPAPTPKPTEQATLVQDPTPVIKPVPTPKPQPTPEQSTTPKIDTPPVVKDLIAEQRAFAKKLRRLYQCSKLDLDFNGEKLAGITGFVSSAADARDLLTSMQTVNRVEKPSFRIQVRPWPQCEALLTFDPFLHETVQPVLKTLSGDIKARSVFRDGEKLVVSVQTPDYPSYLYVTYLQSSGDAVHLAGFQKRSEPYPANSEIILGNSPKEPTYTISEPFGSEMMFVVASQTPLFEDNYDIVEEERSFLTRFRQAILALQNDPAKGRVSANAAYLTTRAQSAQ